MSLGSVRGPTAHAKRRNEVNAEGNRVAAEAIARPQCGAKGAQGSQSATGSLRSRAGLSREHVVDPCFLSLTKWVSRRAAEIGLAPSTNDGHPTGILMICPARLRGRPLPLQRDRAPFLGH